MVIALRAPRALAAAVLYAASTFGLQASPTCPDEQPVAQVPLDLNLCKSLESVVRNPGGLPLDQYEAQLGRYLGAFCHRDTAGGWHVDKRVRDTGPWVATYRDGKWRGQYYGTHAPVMVWYSPDFYGWLKKNRPDQGPAPASVAPVPDGAMIIKEMYPAPAAACASVDPLKLLPNTHGSAVMVRDSKVAHDGWFWGWYGWPGSGWGPDWPAPNTSPMQNMGFGQYCTNCHASAVDNQTFSALKNIKGEAGEPSLFLSQDFFQDPTWQSHHLRVLKASKLGFPPPKPEPHAVSAFTRLLAVPSSGIPLTLDQMAMQPTTYDNVWVKPGGPTAASQFVTSDQCLGCHDAGSTGLQFDMTQPGTDTQMINNSPYGTWRGSPMGLAGRDPIFFAQLASETDTFHKDASAIVQDTCLGCHGILGQRQFKIDRYATSGCEPLFPRTAVDAIPYQDPPNDAVTKLAAYGALARDGISCTSCHHMALGEKESAAVQGEPQNACVSKRQTFLNPGLTGFAKTFTGSFLVGPPDRLYGPFEEPKIKPMKNAIGIEPAHNPNIKSSELCGSCHTVHLPVMFGGNPIAYSYEQTTYPEWAFSAYRTGDTPDGPLPFGPGTLAQSCQDCHMPNKDAAGHPNRSKIASIQEYSNFPKTENTLPPKDIDLQVREGFGKHTLVGLNVFLLEMAAQFPKLLGIRPSDPMLGASGVDSIPNAKAAMMDQAMNRTATVSIAEVRSAADTLSARVTVANQVGHKFPSGVGFRRAFLEFSVLDRESRVIWSSGRTDSSGVLVDENGAPIAGEKWWTEDCSSRIDPDARIHQPHYQEITRQDQVQIFQELVSTPPGADAKCGRGVQPPQGQLTTSFLSICTTVKDNRLLPQGFLNFEQRKQISKALGAGDDMAEDSGAVGVGNDPDYVSGGGDSLTYRIPLSALKGNARPAAVLATLYYQATPPFFLQDRFCTSKSTDTQRLSYLAGKLDLGPPAQDWKLRVVSSGPVAVPTEGWAR